MATVALSRTTIFRDMVFDKVDADKIFTLTKAGEITKNLIEKAFYAMQRNINKREGKK